MYANCLDFINSLDLHNEKPISRNISALISISSLILYLYFEVQYAFIDQLKEKIQIIMFYRSYSNILVKLR